MDSYRKNGFDDWMGFFIQIFIKNVFLIRNVSTNFVFHR